MGDTLTALPFGTFGGADAIAVHRKVNGIVTEIEFVYHASGDVRALGNGYRSSLGQPFAITVDTIDHSNGTTTRWRDATTDFVLITMVPADKVAVGAFAQLIDRR